MVRKRRKMQRMMMKMMKEMKQRRQGRKMTDRTICGSVRQCRDMKHRLLVNIYMFSVLFFKLLNWFQM